MLPIYSSYSHQSKHQIAFINFVNGVEVYQQNTKSNHALIMVYSADLICGWKLSIHHIVLCWHRFEHIPKRSDTSFLFYLLRSDLATQHSREKFATRENGDELNATNRRATNWWRDEMNTRRRDRRRKERDELNATNWTATNWSSTFLSHRILFVFFLFHC